VSPSPAVATTIVSREISALQLQRESVYSASWGRPRFTEWARFLCTFSNAEHQVASVEERMRSDVALVKEALTQPVGDVALRKPLSTS
jgi:hypothetical protein